MFVLKILIIILICHFAHYTTNANIDNLLESSIKSNISNHYNNRYESYIMFRDDSCDQVLKSSHSITFVQLPGLRQTMDAVFYAVANNIPGDFADFGVWRGGTAILMAKALQWLDPTSLRKVHLFDSFVGVPNWKELGEKDLDNGRVVNPNLSGFGNLSSGSSVEEVKKNMIKYDLKEMLSKKLIVFHKGWFNETVPNSKINQLAVIRADAGASISTRGILAIYPALSKGGVYIVDDYHEYIACSSVIDEFFINNKINPSKLDKNAYRPYWIK